MTDIFYFTISENKEFQGMWKDTVLSYLSNTLIAPEDNVELVETEIHSQRFKIFVLLLKIAIHTIEKKRFTEKNSETLEIFDKHYDIADNICRSNFRFITEVRVDENLTTEDIERRTSLTTNYPSPIRWSIIKRGESWMDRFANQHKKWIDRIGVNDALALYLESDIRDIRIDRLFLTMLSDSEIIGYIEEVGIPALPPSKDGTKSLLGLDESKLSIEDKIIDSFKGFKGSWSRSFVRWLSASVVISVIPFFINHLISLSLDPWVERAGIGVAFILMLFWLFTFLFEYKAYKKTLKNVDKLFPITDSIVEMNFFYQTIREESPLPVSEIKKGMKLLKDANVFMPILMVAIIEDLEDRKVRWI